jgi:hypothetical protein
VNAHHEHSPNLRGAQGVVYSPESSKIVPWLVVTAIVSGSAIGLSIYAIATSRNSDRETRMLEYYVMELDGKAMRAGIIRPEESWSGKKREGAK